MTMSKTAAITATAHAVTIHGSGTSWTIYGPYYRERMDGPSTSSTATTYPEARKAAAKWRAHIALSLMGLTDDMEAYEDAEYAMYDSGETAFRALLDLGIAAASKARIRAA